MATQAENITRYPANWAAISATYPIPAGLIEKAIK